MQKWTAGITIWIALLISSVSLLGLPLFSENNDVQFEEQYIDETYSSARSSLSWSLSAGGFDYDEILDLVVSDNGETYVAGKFTSSISYGDESGLQATGMANDVDFFVGKISTNNTWDWIVGGGSTAGEDSINAIDITPEGDIVVSGLFCMGTVGNACQLEIIGLSATSKGVDENEGNAFIAKLGQNGSWQWVETFGSDFDETIIDIAVDSFGDIYISALHRGMMSVGGNNLIAGEEETSMAYLRMDENGTWDFVKQIMSSGGIEPFGAICEAPGGNMYLIGTYMTELLFDPDMIEAVGMADVFVALMLNNGSTSWVRSAGGLGDDFVKDCDTNSTGALTIVGSIDNSANFGNETNITPSGWIDAFIATIDYNGNWVGAEAVGGVGWEEFNGVKMTANDEALVVGRMGNAFNLSQFSLTSAGGSDTLLAQRGENGSWQWALSGGGPSDDFGVAVDLRDNAPISANSFSGTASFSGAENTSQGDTDFAIWGYAQDVDGDGITDGEDNCLQTSNPDQSDLDLDGEGDACEDDIDGDGLMNGDDDCPIGQTGWFSNSQSDHDGDGCLDAAEDLDDDNDGINDTNDTCSKGPIGWISDISNDQDQDGCEDIDSDSDGFVDQLDNCPSTSNPQQDDLDGDGIGNACENDTDGDGIDNALDNCQAGLFGWTSSVSNDLDGDGCKDNGEDDDDDGDSISDLSDDCRVGNTGWISDNATDHDGDGCKDSLEDDDDDNDAFDDDIDLCPLGVIGISPLGQDLDNDGCNDLLEDDDKDNDGVVNSNDSCSGTAIGSTVNTEGCSPSQRDTDGDGIKDVTDQCPGTSASINVDSLGCEIVSNDNNDGTSGANEEDDAGLDIMTIGLIIGVLILVAGAGVVTWMGKQTPKVNPAMQKINPVDIATITPNEGQQNAVVEEDNLSNIEAVD
jgi:hypothetical protein